MFYFRYVAFDVMCYLPLQNEARKINHQEVVEEDKRLKLPTNWEAKKARLEWEVAEDEKKKVITPPSIPLVLNAVVLCICTMVTCPRSDTFADLSTLSTYV